MMGLVRLELLFVLYLRRMLLFLIWMFFVCSINDGVLLLGWRFGIFVENIKYGINVSRNIVINEFEWDIFVCIEVVLNL